MSRAALTMAGSLFAAVLLAGCGGDEASQLSVIAATSLKVPFTKIAEQYEAANPGAVVRTSFAPSDKIARQIKSGFDGNIVATADRAQMAELEEADVVARPESFAGNRLVIAVSDQSRAKVDKASDLAGNARISVGASDVPVGSYAEQAIDKLDARYGNSYGDAVRANFVSRGQSAADVITPVALGGVDVSISYSSDLRAVAGRVKAVSIPAFAQPQISYWIAPTASADPAAAEFIAYVRSAKGQVALQASGFTSSPSVGAQ